MTHVQLAIVVGKCIDERFGLQAEKEAVGAKSTEDRADLIVDEPPVTEACSWLADIDGAGLSGPLVEIAEELLVKRLQMAKATWSPPTSMSAGLRGGGSTRVARITYEDVVLSGRIPIRILTRDSCRTIPREGHRRAPYV